jgi:hypothetical protein
MGVFVDPAANIDTVYRLPTKENKLPCSISVYSKQKEVCHFHFLFAANKQKLLFYVRLYTYMRKTAASVYLLHIYICCCFKGIPEAQATFLNLFTVCSSSKTADCHLSIY